MRLYGSPTSPFVRKVRVFAAERGSPISFVPEDPWQKTDLLLSLNPLGKVPVLACDDGRQVIDSLAIIDFLDQAGAPRGRLLADRGPERWDALHWHVIAHGLIDATVTRLLETRRPIELQLGSIMTREEARIGRILAFAEARVAEIEPQREARPGFAALMLGVALVYLDFRYRADWRADHPRLAAFIGGLGERPSFLETRPPGP